MEVGAVKQAFNNEVILLKKKLNQAKIQIIHKLTRKAKTLTGKKAPENLKVKFTKKADSAVKEVLIIKKIKARDVARFIVTHKGQLNEYLNKPTVDMDKACARLLLHKALQDKYKVMRDRFSNISIKDLLMSRQERRKLKKEAREQQKNKKKGKDSKEPIQAEGNWDVEDVNIEDSQMNSEDSPVNESDNDDLSSGDEQEQEEDKNDESDESENNVVSKPSLILKDNVNSKIVDGANESSESNDENESDDGIEQSKDLEKNGDESDEADESCEDESVGKFVKLASSIPDDKLPTNNNETFEYGVKLKENIKRQVEKKHKDSNKNKNLKNKILLKKFNKEKSEIPQDQKVVDPFFITATGENYMSVAETRPPDEVKEEHRQGNRKYRRAVMFGHVPKPKFRNVNSQSDKNSRFSKFNDNNNRGNFKDNGFDKYGSQKRFDKPIESNRGNFKDKRFDKNIVNDDSKPEKLHPSWEAKKRQSGILPFQGKKIVFDEG